MSQARAGRAIAAGRFDAEIAPVTIEGKKGTTMFSRDEHPFPDASMEKLGKLAPVFSKTGTVTAGNSSGITDGAAAVVLASEHFVKQNNLKPLARISAVTSAGASTPTVGIRAVSAMWQRADKNKPKPQPFCLISLQQCLASHARARA